MLHCAMHAHRARLVASGQHLRAITADTARVFPPQVRDQVPLSEALKHNLVMGLGVGFAFALVAAIFR